VGTRDPGFTMTELADYRATCHIVVSSDSSRRIVISSDSSRIVPC